MSMGKKLKITFIFLFLLFFIGVLTYVAIDLIEPIKIASQNKSFLPIEERFVEYGIFKYLFIAICQAAMLIAAVVPTEVIQIIAGFSCGAIRGFLICLLGIFLGNVIIFLMVRKFKSFVSPNQDIKKDGKYDKSFWIALSFYFIPGISYGSAAIYAANTKMNFFKYILLTTLAAIPAVMICTLFGHVAIQVKYIYFTTLISFYCVVIMICFAMKSKLGKHLKNASIRGILLWSILFIIDIIFSIYYTIVRSFLGLLISLGVFVLLIILYLLLNKYIHNLFARSRKKYNMKYFQGKIKKPNGFLYGLFAKLFKPIFFKKFNVKVNKESIPKIDNPSIVMFNHPSMYDFLYSFIPIYPKKVNVVTAYYYFCNYHLGRLLKKLGAFPKYLYQPDVSAMKNIIKVIKDGGVLGIAPEGRLSAYGALEKIIPSTAKMIKRFGVQVVMAKIDGAYFSSPKWATTSRKGKIEVTFKEVFTPEQIKNLEAEEIYEILKKEFDYDDYRWQEKNHVAYKGKKFAEGLEQILYLCPICNNEYSYESNKDTLTCSCCGNKVVLDKYYNLLSDNEKTPKTIKDWYLYQKKVERDNIEKENYLLSSHVTLKLPDPDGRGFKISGHGQTTLTTKGVHFKGIINDEEKELFFDIKNVPAVPFGVREDFEIYHDNTLYYFIPDNIRECVKWSVVAEQIYKKYLDDNNLTEWRES